MSAHGSHTSRSVPPRSRFYKGLFGRLFPDLLPWEPPFPGGASGTSGEAADVFFKKIAADRMIDPGNTPDSVVPVAYTYFGQFIDHDITFDPLSSLARQNDPDIIHNFRTPRLDLDNVYGSGPGASPHLYEKGGHRFLIGKGRDSTTGNDTNEPDLPRNDIGTALVGDPRNDENKIVSQLQLAFLKFHNRIFDDLVAGGSAPDKAFDEARRVLTWTYQHIVWNDFVKRLISNDLWSNLLKLQTTNGVKRWQLGNQFFRWKNTPFMPVEFSVAAYRFGHSLVRNGYQLNTKIGFGTEVPIFDMTGTGSDLRGGTWLPPEHSLQWDWFLELPSSGGPFPQLGRKFDPLLAQALAAIPAGPGGVNALAFLNLKRGWRMGLPSGPDVARYMGIKPITTDPEEESLWFYILKEAGSLPGTNGGNMLGRVGGTIVGEVFAGLLHGDPNSYFSIQPNWTPDQEPILQGKGPVQTSGEWTLADIIRIAQMPETQQQTESLIDTGSF